MSFRQKSIEVIHIQKFKVLLSGDNGASKFLSVFYQTTLVIFSDRYTLSLLHSLFHLILPRVQLRRCAPPFEKSPHRTLAPQPKGLAPLPTGNPGSATVLDPPRPNFCDPLLQPFLYVLSCQKLGHFDLHFSNFLNFQNLHTSGEYALCTMY